MATSLAQQGSRRRGLRTTRATVRAALRVAVRKRPLPTKSCLRVEPENKIVRNSRDGAQRVNKVLDRGSVCRRYNDWSSSRAVLQSSTERTHDVGQWPRVPGLRRMQPHPLPPFLQRFPFPCAYNGRGEMTCLSSCVSSCSGFGSLGERHRQQVVTQQMPSHNP